MELWIRTQLKNGLIKVNDIYVSLREGIYSLESKDFVLGMYKTEKRALEVLDEIQKKLNARKESECSVEYILIDNIAPVIYEMPKE